MNARAPTQERGMEGGGLEGQSPEGDMVHLECPLDICGSPKLGGGPEHWLSLAHSGAAGIGTVAFVDLPAGTHAQGILLPSTHRLLPGAGEACI